VSKGIPVKIPEPEGWTECLSLSPAAVVPRGGEGLHGSLLPWGVAVVGEGFKGHSLSGNAKSTLGTLFVNLGRDFFSS